MKPGEYLIDNALDLITINSDRATASVLVRHTGDRPIQVGSHFHFFEVNRALDFDRAVAYGMRLDIAAGMAVRFQAGEEKIGSLVAVCGHRGVFGPNRVFKRSLDGFTIKRKTPHKINQKKTRK